MSQVNEKIDDLEKELLADLESMDKQSYKSEFGTISMMVRSSVKTPKTLEDKLAFFEYLKEKGIFNELVSVNSQSLNKLYKDEQEAALARGEFLKIPGLNEVSDSITLSFRKN